MGLLTNSRSRAALGGSLGTRRTLGGYRLNDKAALAERAQSSVASTAKAMTKKSSETKNKVSDIGKASLGLNALALGAKVYQVANTPDRFGDMDFTAQQEYLKTLSPAARAKFLDMYGEKVKSSPTDMAKTEVTKGADIPGTGSDVTKAGDLNTGPDTALSEGKVAMDKMETVATGADQAQLVSEAGTIGEGVESIAAIGDGLEVVDAGTTALDTTGALGFFG